MGNDSDEGKVEMAERLCEESKIEAKWIVVIFLIFLPMIFGNFVSSEKLRELIQVMQLGNSIYAEKDYIGLEFRDIVIYLDKNTPFSNTLCLQQDYDWLFNCKLLKDFGWYATSNTYLVYTTFDRINMNREHDSRRMAYYQPLSGNSNKYIFVWEMYDTSLIHELAHFADDVHDNISQMEEWKKIYVEEWQNNEWLDSYKKESFSEEEQLSLYLKESFAEGFAQWYFQYYENIISGLSVGGDPVDHMPYISIVATQESHPKTFLYMENFYNNYEYDDGFLKAVELGYTVME